MSGITAFIRIQEESPPLEHLLERALNATYPLPGIKRVTMRTNAANVVFGGAFPKHFQRDSETHNEGGKAVLFYGELYNDLGGKDEAEFALQCYRCGDENALRILNGPFTFFLHDNITRELTVVTDRLGRFPVFFGKFGTTLFFTTDLDSLFNGGVVAPHLDDESITDFLTIGFPLGERSLFSGVKRITGGTVLRVSGDGISQKMYWAHRCSDSSEDTETLVQTFRECVARAVRRPSEIAITLSGGWDSRATSAALPAAPEAGVCAVTYGVPESSDATIARRVAEALRIPHILLPVEGEFFENFSGWTDKVLKLSSGHATADLAFQLYNYDRLRDRFPVLLDSAGCEFRRGIRARYAVRHAGSNNDISRFLTSMYSTGIWNSSVIDADYYRDASCRTEKKLTRWFDATDATFAEQVDRFSTEELWAHNYAHGYPLQTSIIGCAMPFSDNEFYDVFLRSGPGIRWTHAFHRAVIHTLAPSLEKIPISYGSCKVSYAQSVRRYIPVLYHQALSRIAPESSPSWLRTLDPYKPFRPYHRWYANELRGYVDDTLRTSLAEGFLDAEGVDKLLCAARSGLHDHSHAISILITFVNLIAYTRSFSSGAPCPTNAF
jgi:hypothetical protein